jgi:hypothetical protein
MQMTKNSAPAITLMALLLVGSTVISVTGQTSETYTWRNIGFGKAAPGQTYPALYTSAKAGGVRAIYRSTDAGASWVRIDDNQHH